jgi:8-oxo-dGTP diphosphatase
MSVFARLPRRVRVALIHLGTPSFSAGAVLLLRRADGRICLVEQRHSRAWALPGGLLERGETPLQCLVREAEEEIGLRLDPGRLGVPYASVAPVVRRLDVVFTLDATDHDRPVVGTDADEVLDVGWFALDALPEVTLPTLDILRDIRVL